LALALAASGLGSDFFRITGNSDAGTVSISVEIATSDSKWTLRRSGKAIKATTQPLP